MNDNVQFFRSSRAQTVLRKFPIVYSVDMHDDSHYGFMIDSRTGTVLEDKNIQGKLSTLVKHLEKYHTSRKDSMVILFEAGGLGFSPYRTLTKAGYECLMIAPSSIPKSGKRQKSDRQDAIDNFHYFAAGSLRMVTAPTEKDEEIRELLRYRQEVNHRATKQKQRILSFLKRHGQEFTGTKTNWTKKHYEWLRTVAMPSVLRATLDFELKDLIHYQEQIACIDKELDLHFETDPHYKKLSMGYQCIAGIGRIGAMTLVLEGGDLSRFYHPNALMNFVGLVPLKHSSGKSDPALHITKAGNGYLRLALVTAARMYSDRRRLRKTKDIQKLPELMQEFIYRLQDRLANRYRYLTAKGKNSNKAKCAIARELCGFLWEYATKIMPNIPEHTIEDKKAA